MAKNKISVDLEVDDKGSLKKVSNSADKASKSVDKVAKGSSTADRNLKGVAGASSNATKNFSKMSQGMGGVLGAYANLAASLFAISAAFNFLKSAGDLKVLEQGQILYAAKTGVAMGALAKDIIAATDAQITFSDASQAAAIGLAAGLSQEQLKDLGKAAKDTSLILGRDVTDSFNRLVRGVTKAEPELLDELGIILRLNDANEKYAAKLGKSANSLTQFEKSQAVANDVLDQARTKFSDIIGDDTEVNVYNQLAKSFDDLIRKVKEVVDVIAEPFAKAITKTPLLGVAALGLLVKGPLQALGVNFGEMTIKSKEAWKSQRAYYTDLKTQAAAASISVQGATDKLKAQAAQITSLGSKSAILKKLSEGGVLKGPDRANLQKALKAAELEYKASGEITKGIFKGVDIAIVRDFKLAMNQMAVAQEGLVTKTKIVTTKLQLYWNTVKLGLQGLKTAAITAGAFMLNAFGWISLAITLFTVLADYMGWFNKEQSKAEKAAEALTEKLKGLNKQWTKFYETQRKLMASGNTSSTIIGIGNQLQSLNIEENITSINKFLTLRKEEERLQKDINRSNLAAQQGGFFDKKIHDRNVKGLIKIQKGITEAIEEEFNQYKKMIPLLQQRVMLTDGADQSATNLLKVLTVGGPAEEIEKAVLAEQNLAMALTAANEAAKAATQSVGSFYGALNKNNGADAALSDINNYFINMEQQATNLGQAFEKGISPLENWRNLLSKSDGNLQAFGLGPEEASIIKAYIKQADTITKINQTRHEFEIAGIKLATEREKKYRTALGYEKDHLKAKDAVEDSERSIAKIVQDRLDILSGARAESYDQLEGAAKRAYETAEQQLGLEKQVLLTARQRELIEVAILGIKRDLYSLDFEGKVLAAQQSLVQSLEKERGLRQQIFNDSEKLANLENNKKLREFDKRFGANMFMDEKKSELALQLAKDFEQRRLENIQAEYDLKVQAINLEYGLLESRLKIAQLEATSKAREASVTGDSVAQSAYNEIANLNKQMLQGLSGQRDTALTAANSSRKTAVAEILDRVSELEFANEQLSDTSQILNTIENSFTSNFQSAISSLIEGTASVKDAFKSMALSILKSIADVISQLIVANILKTMLGGLSTPIPAGQVNTSALSVGSGLGPTSTSGFSLPGFKNGGLVGNKMQGYNTGGVAKGPNAGYPVMMHGTEAIVPLPDGKSIPVSMSGSAGQNNNVTVNVAIDSNGNASTNTEQSSAEAGNMGNLIAKAVQKELQNQKRSGGILSPYGVA